MFSFIHYFQKPLIALAIGLLCSCATLPADNSISARGTLFLCNGMTVSNAPNHDVTGELIKYSQTIVVHRVSLLRAPVHGCLSSSYGPRRGGAGNIHKGIDLFTGSQKPVIAAGAGKIQFIGTLKGYGRTIVIDHGNDVTTRYGHLSSYGKFIKVGLRVATGDVIGRSGASGNATAVHLHYEVRIRGRAINPLSTNQSSGT